jgi:hypothetical protein
MKRLFFFLALLFVCSFSVAQPNFDFQVVFNPTLSWRYVTGDAETKEFLRDVHKPIIRYDVGVLVTALKKSQLSVETGLIYSRKGLSYGEISFRDINNDPMGSVKVALHTDFIEVPVRIIYSLSQMDRHYLVGGLLTDILLQGKYKTKTSGEFDGFVQEDPSGLRKLNVGFQFGYGQRLFKTETFSLDLEPNIKFQLGSFYTGGSTTRVHLYTIGVTMKAHFKS